MAPKKRLKEEILKGMFFLTKKKKTSPFMAQYYYRKP